MKRTLSGVADGISPSWLDGRHVVFGEVLSGMDVVTAIEHVKTDSSSRPEVVVKIVKSGEVKEEDEPSAPSADEAQEEGKDTGKQEL